MKQCIACGAELHEDASFCHSCGTSQVEKKRSKLPYPWKKKLLCMLLVLTAMVTAMGLGMRSTPVEEPTQEAQKQVIPATATIEQPSPEILHYQTDDGENYEIRLSFSTDGEAEEYRSKMIAADQGKDGSFPSLLYIIKESNGKFVNKDFIDQWVEEISIECLPQNGAQALELGEPEYDEREFPQAASKANVFIGSYNVGDNVIRWTLTMKNGDILTLEQTVTIELMEVQTYSWTEESMNSLSELNALLERLDQSTEKDQVVEICLPPVTYEGGLDLRGRSFRLYGSADENGQMTTFTQPSVIEVKGGGKMEFNNICFRGDGGTGLSCLETVFLDNCIFEDWDIGVHVQNQGWSQSDFCTYRNNQIGLLFDCSEDGSFGPDYDENLFENNEIGVQIKAVHKKRTLSFDNTVFRNNVVDIDNQFGQDLDLSRTIFQ